MKQALGKQLFPVTDKLCHRMFLQFCHCDTCLIHKMVLCLSQLGIHCDETPAWFQPGSLPSTVPHFHSGQVHFTSHGPIRYQKTDHWNPVPHTIHLGSNSRAGSKNMQAPTTRKYSQPWVSSNRVFKLWPRLTSVKNCLKDLCWIHQVLVGSLCLLSSGGVLTRTLLLSRQNTLMCCPHLMMLQTHIHAPAPEARQSSLRIISGILVLISMRE